MKWTHAQKRGFAWLYAFLMTVFMFVMVFWKLDMRYAINDDSSILRSFMGYGTGEPVNFHIFIHGILAWPLCWLGNAFPGIPWFSWAQMVMLFICCVVLAKGIMQCFLKHGKPMWMGAVFAALFLFVLALYYVTVFSFTLTAGLLGGAAVMQILSIEHEKPGKVVLGMAGALVLVAYAYSLRQIAALPILAFCGIAFALTFLEDYGFGKAAKRSAKPMVISIIMVAVVMLGLVGVREVEIRKSGAQDYLAWQESNSEIIDYYGLANVPQEAFDLVGWDENLVELTAMWCFLDNDISTEAFQTMEQYVRDHDTRTFSDRVVTAAESVKNMFIVNRTYSFTFILPLLVGLAVLIGALFCKPGKRIRLVLGVLAALALTAVMLLYLGFRGRLPIRAVLIVIQPCAAFFFALLPSAIPNFKRTQTVMGAVMVLCIAVAAWSMQYVMPSMIPDEEMELMLGSAMGDLEEYASGEPESLFLFDSILLGADQRAFPTYAPDEIPMNISFWGGWGMRSPENIQQFEHFDIDVLNFDPEILLRGDVYLASGRVDPPPVEILNWLRKEVDPNIDWEIYSEYGNVYIFQFVQY